MTLLFAARSTSANADEFMALPGLWKTEFKIQAADGKNKPESPLWHCVDEDADPWIAFAQLQPTPQNICARTSFNRGSTSLKWRLDCTGPGVAVNEGSLSFDSPGHYTGVIKLSGSLMDYPVHEVVKVEGHRVAACTSPAD